MIFFLPPLDHSRLLENGFLSPTGLEVDIYDHSIARDCNTTILLLRYSHITGLYLPHN